MMQLELIEKGMVGRGNMILVSGLRHPERSRLSGGARACPEQAQRVEGDLAGSMASLKSHAESVARLVI
jgi:hypothetical protein